MDDQMIFRRYELKYLITRPQQQNILDGMLPFMVPDAYGHSSIQSLYYDTPDFILARRSIEKPLYKEKLRLRSYGKTAPDSDVFIEIKKKYEGIVYKRRVGMPLNEAVNYLSGKRSGLGNGSSGSAEGSSKRLGSSGLTDNDSSATDILNRQIFSEIDYFLKFYGNLQPRIMLQYERDAYYAGDDSSFRVTFDENICYRTEALSMDSGVSGKMLLDDDYVLMEVKVNEAMPLWFVSLLTQNHINQTSFSKYGTAYILESGQMNKIPSDVRNVLSKSV